ANGNEADIGVSFTDVRGKLGNLPFDSNRENYPVCFQRTNGIEALCKEGIHHFGTAIPTIAFEYYECLY
ncbi:MAG: hypothetical protein K2O18_18215, partial [Oscillospiraceae bacterium]|nr:hypothetical protein [Oscillospiraceae bacterium]